MRVLFFSLVVLSTLIGVHASALKTQQLQHPHISSHIFHSMNNNNNFLPPGVSQACDASTNDLQNNPLIIAANASIIHQGCLNLNVNDPNVCTTNFMTSPVQITCSCQPILLNTDWLYGNVSALGGKVCPLSIAINVIASVKTKTGQPLTINENMQQTLNQLAVLGKDCTDKDMQSGLDYSLQQGLARLSNAKGVTIVQYKMSASGCGLSSSLSGGAGGAGGSGTLS